MTSRKILSTGKIWQDRLKSSVCYKCGMELGWLTIAFVYNESCYDCSFTDKRFKMSKIYLFKFKAWQKAYSLFELSMEIRPLQPMSITSNLTLKPYI